MNGQIPAPAQGLYVPARRHGELIFVSGMTPRRNGTLLHTGQVGLDAPAEIYCDAVEIATENALQAAAAQLISGEQISAVLALTVYVNAPPGYTRHSQIADLASRYLERNIVGGGLPSRAAIGVASLPGGAVTEISLVAVVRPPRGADHPATAGFPESTPTV